MWRRCDWGARRRGGGGNVAGADEKRHAGNLTDIDVQKKWIHVKKWVYNRKKMSVQSQKNEFTIVKKIIGQWYTGTFTDIDVQKIWNELKKWGYNVQKNKLDNGTLATLPI